MSDGRTADARLERLLHVLPAAMREGGAELDGLADALETTQERIFEDLEELTSRVYYRPGGWPDDVQIVLERGRVRVVRAAGFERPVRLTRDETLCLALALRGSAAEAHVPDPEAREALLARAEQSLGAPGFFDVRDVSATHEGPPRPMDVEGVRETLMVASRDRRPCAIWYVKAGATDGSVRVVHPYAIAYAEGQWYAVAHCTSEDGVRVFRMDRVLASDLADGEFEVPADFDVGDFVQGGRVFHAREDQQVHDVRVRYGPRIARWVRERAQWEPERIEHGADGSIFVRHRVVDPSWAVGHALMYGAEAEVIEPVEIRALVRDAVREIRA